jgi:O-methyltransferase
MFYGIPSDRVEKFQQALDYIIETYEGYVFATDMNISIARNLSFSNDQKFVSSFESIAQNEQESSLIWRLHVLTWAAGHALQIEGDFVECGVFNGFSSAVVCKYLDFASVPKSFYLYDTFSGLPEETATEMERLLYPYEQCDSEETYAHVKNTFAAYPNVKVIRGIVPHSFTEAAPDQIAFLHIDMNSTQAEILALEHLFHKISPGGLMILDDFGWQAHRDQMLAETEFLQALGYKVLELPTGQGLVLKH